jgi:enoyl-CoA hydratase
MTGSERAFAAGADVKEMAEANPRYAREFSGLAIEINNILESMSIPTIAAVGGYAFGGGCEMTLACDFRVGGSRTTLSFPEVGLGIIPGANGCARATAIVGPAKAKQLVMLTEMIPGKQAYDLGLLNWYVEGDAELDAAAKEAKKAAKAAKASGDEAKIAETKAAQKAAEAAAAKAEYDAIYGKAVEVAKQLKTKPGCALAAAKAAINKAAIESIAAGKAAETTEFTLLFDTHDQKEGMAAMIEKRPAVFTNN